MFFKHRFITFLRLGEEKAKLFNQIGANRVTEVKPNLIGENTLTITQLKVGQPHEVSS